MRYILLSADNAPVLYEAPDRVAESLPDYCFRFLDEINSPDSPCVRMMKDPSGQEYALLSYTELDFLSWLNRQPESRDQPVREAAQLSKQERELIMETARREQHLPCEHQKYPWFHF